MATVTVTFTDNPVLRQTVIRVESADPPFPTKDGTADLEHLTPAQASAFGAVMEVAGLADTMRLFVMPPGPS